MSFKQGVKYLILSGGKINTDQNYALTCDSGIKEKSAMKFSVSLEDAVSDERCHFEFEENNYEEKSDSFKWFIKSSKNPDLFLCFGEDLKIEITGLNIKVILNNGYSSDKGYKYSFDVSNQDFCNYKLSGYYYDIQTKRNQTYRFSSYKNTDKGKEFVLSIDTPSEFVEKTKDNFLFRIIPLDVTFCYQEQKLTENILREGVKVIIVPGTKPTDYRALTCVKGVTEKSQLRAGTPFEFAFDDPNCQFTIVKNPYLSGYYAMKMTDGNDKTYFLTTSGFSIEHSLFKTSLPVELNSKGGLYDYEYLLNFKPEGCFYKMYGVFPEGSDNVYTDYRMSTYENTHGLLALSVGYDDYAAENKENFLFRVIPVSNTDTCDSLYNFKTLDNYTLKPCDNNKFRIMSDKFVLSDSFIFQFMENVRENGFCFDIKPQGEGFAILNNKGVNLAINMDQSRKKILQFVQTKDMFITNDREKLQTWNIYNKETKNIVTKIEEIFNKKIYISSTPTDCVKSVYFLKNQGGMLKMVEETIDSLTDEHEFIISKKEEKIIENFEGNLIKKKDFSFLILAAVVIIILIIILISKHYRST